MPCKCSSFLDRYTTTDRFFNSFFSKLREDTGMNTTKNASVLLENTSVGIRTFADGLRHIPITDDNRDM